MTDNDRKIAALGWANANLVSTLMRLRQWAERDPTGPVDAHGVATWVKRVIDYGLEIGNPDNLPCLFEDTTTAATTKGTTASEAGREASAMASGWQPIETAPKDGTIILVWLAKWLRGKGCPATALWSQSHDRWVYFPNCESAIANMTHWMPILTLSRGG